MPLVSVIIPAYNAAKTIGRTLRSVMASTIPLDIWVVDDGSTDGTGALLDAFLSSTSTPQSNSSQLHIIHQLNQGCYRARLSGLRAIRTEYFGFVDADDLIDPRMFERLLSVAQKTAADVVECGWKIVGDKRKFSLSPVSLKSQEEVMGGYVRPVLFGYGHSAYVWNKLYRNQYDFTKWVDGNFGSYEDLIHNLQLFVCVNSYERILDSLYLYAPNEGSVTRNYNPAMLNRLIETVRAKAMLVKEFSCDGTDRLLSGWIRHEFQTALYMASTVGRSGYSERIEMLQSIYDNEYFPFRLLRLLPKSWLLRTLRMAATLRGRKLERL